ncbi:hypothetical protein GJAV_G00066480 [Gymnothorax javanicus]|nr:hypothetical protein GJAV_G00066480 [Gymnothorax javanicus]
MRNGRCQVLWRRAAPVFLGRATKRGRPREATLPAPRRPFTLDAETKNGLTDSALARGHEEGCSPANRYYRQGEFTADVWSASPAPPFSPDFQVAPEEEGEAFVTFLKGIMGQRLPRGPLIFGPLPDKFCGLTRAVLRVCHGVVHGCSSITATLYGSPVKVGTAFRQLIRPRVDQQTEPGEIWCCAAGF